MYSISDQKSTATIFRWFIHCKKGASKLLVIVVNATCEYTTLSLQFVETKPWYYLGTSFYEDGYKHFVGYLEMITRFLAHDYQVV
jgi:hypothetical protein